MVVAVAASVAAFGATSGAAQTVVATMSGETFDACTVGEELGRSIGCSPIRNSLEARIRCNPDGSGRLTYTAFGAASGPYPGTFFETGTILFNPRGAGQQLPPLADVRISFTVQAALGTRIEGRKYIVTPTGFGLCSGTGALGDFLTIASANVRYEAIIKPFTGGSFADEGTALLEVKASHLESAVGATSDVVTSAGTFVEFFRSDLAAARPLLPDAKEQCKDEGFLIFGVFENQGDCVSFVTTHGKNEPGKNEPMVP